MLADWIPTLVASGVAVVVLGLVPAVRLALRRSGRTAFTADLLALRWPLRLLIGAVPALVASRKLDHGAARSAAIVAFVAAVVWVMLRVLWVLEQALFRRLLIDASDNLRARSRRTKLKLLRQVLGVMLVLGTAIVTLVAVTPLGRLGPTIVTYAGLIGVVLGFALRSPIENLAAGMIVAISEAIRIDDVVIVEDQWGRVEEIGLVNVVVRVWDDRRLVLPTSRFVNEPFENWTRKSSELIGSVTLWVDFETDIDQLRSDVEAVVTPNPLWDRRKVGTQIVELGERAVRVRVIVSAADASSLWDLRCEVREALLPYLRKQPATVPRMRAEVHGGIELIESPQFGPDEMRPASN